MYRKPYSAAMTKYLFWFSEFRMMVQLLNEGNNMDNIRALGESENLFNARTKYRSLTIFNAISARIKTMPQEILTFFEKTDISTQKVIAVTAIMAAESLFFDFMFEVYREKLVLGENTITMSDFTGFFRNKQSQDEKIAAWTDDTLDRLGRAYRNVLLNSTLIKLVQKNEWSIVKPVINRQLAELMQKSNMSAFYAALSGEHK